jgi:predicted phage tail protein
VAAEGAVLLPGDICVIADPLKTTLLSGGRISSASNSAVVLDRSPVLPSGTWYLYTYGQTGIAQRSLVTSISDNVCNVSGLSSVPTSTQLWLLVNEASEQYFRRYRVQSVKDNNDGTYSVIGILYTDRKFDYMNSGDLSFGNTYTTFNRKQQSAINPRQISFSIRNT